MIGALVTAHPLIKASTAFVHIGGWIEKVFTPENPEVLHENRALVDMKFTSSPAPCHNLRMGSGCFIAVFEISEEWCLF